MGPDKGHFERDYAFGADVKPRAGAARGHLHGHQARRRPRRHAQLHRRADQRELLGHRGARHRRPLLAQDQSGGAGGLSRTSTASSRSRTAPAAAWTRSGMGMQILERTLTGYATHPNFAAVLVVGLGCEANQINAWLATGHLTRRRELPHLQHPGHRRHAQDGREGRRADQRDAAARQCREARAAAARRTSRSGCSAAAPTATRASAPTRRWAHAVDLLVAHGGTAILSRDARGLRRRAPADAPRRAARGRREAGRPHRAGGSTTPRSTRAR